MRILPSLAFTLATLTSASALTLYTNREPALIKPVTDAFTKATGTPVEMLFINNGLLERIEAEGAATKADLVYVTDVTMAELAKSRGLLQGEWTALTMRTRVIYASKERVREDNFTYEELADPKFKGKICIRAGQHPYNLSLISAAMAKMGAGVEPWLTGLKDNLARKAAGGDRDVARDIASGLCDIGIANNYYLGLMAADPVQVKWAEAIKLINPTFKNGGTHTNYSAAFVPKASPNTKEAAAFLAFALKPESQKMLAEVNYEFPVIKDVPITEPLKTYGKFTPDGVLPAILASNRKAASELVDKIGFDR
jgi:iron(III) transport system substrate-binding protein